MICFPNAKINIGLNVVSKRKDGYHNLETIFYPMVTGNADGTGLGLSISYNIVKNHGGELSIESEPGKGTCFSIYLPVKT